MYRKLAALWAALMVSFCAQAMAVCVMQTDRVAALVTREGERLTQAHVIFALVEDALYAVGNAGDYALCDAAGTPLTDERYEMLEAVGDVILCRRDSLYGALDTSGATLLSPEWAALTYAGGGAFLALGGDLYDDQPDEMIWVDGTGQRLNTGSMTLSGLRAFHDGRMAFMMSDGQCGYVDALGRQVIPPQWRYAGDFSDGVAIVADSEGLGLIDGEGSVVIAPNYRWMQRGEGRIAALAADGTLDVYSADGSETVFALNGVTEAEVCGGCIIARNGSAARLYGAEGALIAEAASGTLFYPGLDGQLIVVDGPWGDTSQSLMNPDGSAASGRYQRLMPLCAGRYAYMTFEAGRGDSVCYGLLSADGRVLLPAEYREIAPAGEDRLTLVSDDAVIFADADGNALQQWPISETAAPSSGADA